jgi:hypothetical protein
MNGKKFKPQSVKTNDESELREISAVTAHLS